MKKTPLAIVAITTMKMTPKPLPIRRTENEWFKFVMRDIGVNMKSRREFKLVAIGCWVSSTSTKTKEWDTSVSTTYTLTTASPVPKEPQGGY